MSERDTNFGSNAADLRLARLIRDLPDELTPTRDLWPGIERNIVDYPQRQKRDTSRDLLPYGVAASLVIAMSALMFAMFGSGVREPPYVSFDRSIDKMEAEYVRVRNPMVQEFSETNRDLDPVVLEDLYKNIEIIAQARRDIEDQVRKNPENLRLVEMLMRIHEQELDLLGRDYTQPTRSM